MKKVNFLFFLTSAIWFAGCNSSVVNSVICVQLDPLEKVFTEQLHFIETSDTAAVVKGETATFQFVVRSAYPIQGLKIKAGNLANGDSKIAATLKAFVGYIRAGIHTEDPSKQSVHPVSDLYPDCLQELPSIDVASMQNQPVWVSYAIPRDAAKGDYSATLVFTGKVNGKRFKISKNVNARVYPVVLPEQTLLVNNWWTDRATVITKMNGNQPVEPYSERYWEILTNMVRVMRAHGQNSYKVEYDMGILCGAKLTGTEYTFDFSNFDKMVELLIREGGAKQILGTHLGEAWGGVKVPYMGNIPFFPNVGVIPFDDERAQNYLSQFLPALYSHLKTKGWTDIYAQHVADEPHSEKSQEFYVRFAELVRKHMPGIPIIDALLDSDKLVGAVNIWVPVLSLFHNKYAFYQERQAGGDEVWFYTCVGPQGNYANRFLEQPLIQTRFLHWINYHYGATGYLHWGFNKWDWNKTNDASSSAGFPGGDSWIAYPADGTVFSSIRLAAMRDGIADYELLKLLEQKAPGKAKQLAGAVIKNFNSYDNNVRAFRQTRLQLLKWLSVDNVVFNKPVTHSDFLAPYIGQMAADGNTTTGTSRWVTDDSDSEHWIEIDLQGSFTVHALQMWRDCHNPAQKMPQFSFQAWIGNQWTTVVSENNATGSVAYYKEFKAVTTGKVRLYFPPYKDNRVRLFELEVYSNK